MQALAIKKTPKSMNTNYPIDYLNKQCYTTLEVIKLKINELIDGVRFESTTHEFKKNINPKEDKRWVKTICGFSNSMGGHIYVGVDDHGELFPFEEIDIDTLKMTINNIIMSNTSPLPKYKIDLIEIDSKYVVDISVCKNESGIVFFTDKQYGNQIYIRRDGQTNFATTHEILQLALSTKKYEYDKTIVGIKRDNVSFKYLEEEYKKVYNDENLTDKTLKGMGLVNIDGFLTIAGLLFSDKPAYQNANIVCTTWPDESKGSKMYLDSKKYNGSLIELLHKAIDYIHNVPHYMFGGMKTDARRVDIGSFSDLSLREAIVNAMAHRDYMIDGNEINIDCFKDKIEITSPGSMLHGTNSGYTRLDETTISLRRNSIICGVFEKLKLMENKGSGFAKIVSDYKDLSDAYAPLFRSTDVTFTIKLINKKYVSANSNVTTPITVSSNYLNNLNVFRSRQEIFSDNKNNEIIIKMIENNRNTDYDLIAVQLGITKDGAKYYINKLRDAAMIRREGSTRMGYYEVFNELDRPADFMNLDDETRQRVITWCKKYFIQSDSYNHDNTSYGLKHVFEEDTGIYLTNGQFKGAMLLSGFKNEKNEQLNWYFNISKKSPALYMGKKW
jgi:predicted HTH transcriptional regulator